MFYFKRRSVQYIQPNFSTFSTLVSRDSCNSGSVLNQNMPQGTRNYMQACIVMKIVTKIQNIPWLP